MKNFFYKIAIGTLCIRALYGTDVVVEKPYVPRDFSSLLGNVKGLNDQLLTLHLKLYEGYVKNTNLLLGSLKSVQEDTLAFGALKRRLGWEYDGMRLHELYFESLIGPAEPLSEKDPLYLAIVKDFGSYAAWQKEWIATGLMRGIGWVILYQDPIQKRLLNVWINEHDLGHLAGASPIFVMDVWEHAYMTQYGLERGKYIQAFLDAVNFKTISQRFKHQ